MTTPFSQADIKQAIFRIRVSGGFSDTGTCFLAFDQTHVLTARHVVKNSATNQIATNIYVQVDPDPKQPYYRATVERMLDLDVALLKLDRPVSSAVRPLDVQKFIPTNGTRFYTWGFPDLPQQDWYSGMITGPLEDTNWGIKFDGEFSGQLAGLSGGPVFATVNGVENIVIGLVIRHYENVANNGEIVLADAFYDPLRAPLPDPEPDIPNLCLVLRSEADRQPSRTGSLAPGRSGRLSKVVQDAMQLLPDPPVVQEWFAIEAVASLETYQKMLRLLCVAEIVIFDVTDFEPVIMLLMGIRSVVRRGLNILSFGDHYFIGDLINVPFNIKEANIVSHSRNQDNPAPDDLISERIQKGRSELRQIPNYHDLPVYDAIRNLPVGYRAIDADDILLLCTYDQRYRAQNWKTVLKLQLERKAKAKNKRYIADRQRLPQLFRVLDRTSPRPVSSTIYEAIRRTAVCLVDWTRWRPNVFFEMGVRLAINDETRFTVCIIADTSRAWVERLTADSAGITDPTVFAAIADWAELKPDPTNQGQIEAIAKRLAGQCQALLNLFDPLTYSCEADPDDDAIYEQMLSHYQRTATPDVASVSSAGLVPWQWTFPKLDEYLDLSGENITQSVYAQLTRTADLFRTDSSEAVPAALFPRVRQNYDRGVTSLYRAAWLDLNDRVGQEAIPTDSPLVIDFFRVGWELYTRLANSDDTLKSAIIARLMTMPSLSQALTMFPRNELPLLRTMAKAYQNQKQWDNAHRALQHGIDELLAALRIAPTIAEQTRIKKVLADFYGMRGGTYNRQGKPFEAINMYQQGRGYEIDDSYCLSNSIALQLIENGESIARLREDIRDAVRIIDQQVKGSRANDYYAWADLGQFYALAGNLDKAREAYETFSKLGADNNAFDSAIRVLDQLCTSLMRSQAGQPEGYMLMDASDFLKAIRP